MSKKIKVPRVITRERLGDSDFEAAYEGALKHGKHLAKAEDQLTTATDLSHVLLAFLSQIDDGGFYAAGVISVLIKRLSKARDQLDQHDTEHKNLFIAYCDLKGGAS